MYCALQSVQRIFKYLGYLYKSTKVGQFNFCKIVYDFRIFEIILGIFRLGTIVLSRIPSPPKSPTVSHLLGIRDRFWL